MRTQMKVSLLALAIMSVHASAQEKAQEISINGSETQAVRLPKSDTSPARRIERQAPIAPQRETDVEMRTFDGSNNNINNAEMGSTGIQLRRLTFADYDDGISTLAGENRRSPREISNIVFTQSHEQYNGKGATDFLWQWGQFLDHDIDLTGGVSPSEHEDISVPTGDIYFDPSSTGTVTMSFNRSIYDTNSGTSASNPRQQLNEITAWIDASNVYGSSQERALALRTLDGTGKLKTSAGNFLPFNEEGLPNAGGSGSNLFLAGDVRANEQVGLTAMHTLFVREHNRIASKIAQRNPSLNGDEIYQRARKMVTAEIQVITYKEFIPMLLGRDALRPYSGYKPNVEAGIVNEFSTAAYRLGHSLLSPEILRLDENFNVIANGNLSLRSAFFAPQEILENDIDSILRGLASQRCQGVDTYVIDDVRNFLFGEPGNGGFDLVSLNIQRGRDHGLPSLNDARQALGLPRYTSFAQVTSKPDLRQRLASAYDNVNDIDLWVGGLAENKFPGAMVGETFFRILRHQFEALRDGDRFWYENDLNQEQIDRVEETSLSRVIRQNTNVGAELQRDVFKVRR